MPMNHRELENTVRALLAQGRKVEAVKQVRRETCWGLREAKITDSLTAQKPARSRRFSAVKTR
jgi:ribosomal protein L7/L12